jgi:Holliday junction resolvase RusA-like endonuclease
MMRTPEKTRTYEGRLTSAAMDVMAGREPFERGQPLRCRIVAEFPVAASWSKKRQREAIAGKWRPTGRPDGDNIAKCAGDSLNGIVWHDDGQVVEWMISKRYAALPQLVIEVEPIERDAPRQEAVPSRGRKLVHCGKLP